MQPRTEVTIFATLFFVLGVILGAAVYRAITFAPPGICEYDNPVAATIALCNGEQRPTGGGWRFHGFSKGNPTYRVYHYGGLPDTGEERQATL